MNVQIYSKDLTGLFAVCCTVWTDWLYNKMFSKLYRLCTHYLLVPHPDGQTTQKDWDILPFMLLFSFNPMSDVGETRIIPWSAMFSPESQNLFYSDLFCIYVYSTLFHFCNRKCAENVYVLLFMLMTAFLVGLPQTPLLTTREGGKLWSPLSRCCVRVSWQQMGWGCPASLLPSHRARPHNCRVDRAAWGAIASLSLSTAFQSHHTMFRRAQVVATE